ncbi:MAG: phosphate acetyltransferase [Deltaproteobacteria bacterium]|jgi:phosphate acetyltransferase|nr:phosphate acetyltransferase [Deltaproteobacteria bacterium]
MVKSVFVATPDATAVKANFLDALSGACQSSGGKPGYFKTLVTADDKERLDAYAARLKVGVEELYGLALEEAVGLLNAGRESDVIEKVLAKFSAVAAKFDCVPIEGADLVGQKALVLQGLDGSLAANLAAPVVVVSACAQCATSTRRYFLSNAAEVLAVVLVGDQDADKVKYLASLGTPVELVPSAGDFAPALAPTLEKVKAFKPTVVTPKRFEYDLIERARSPKQRIVLPEGDDERILQAADAILRRDFADLTILGDVGAINAKAKELGLVNLGKAELLDIQKAPFRQELLDSYYELRKAKGATPEEAEKKLSDRNWFGTMMVKAGKANGMVSGAAGSTADTIRPALSLIKTQKGCSVASSVFLMCMKDRVLVFGDCAILTNPTPEQLAEVALISAKTAKAFGVEPKVALLSYSTGSSGTGPDVEAVQKAVELAKANIPALAPGLALDGPMQFDAALDPRTAKSKMPGSPVAGQATVLIFPTLNAGNIGYKAVQRTSGAVAVGPIIQGLNAPVNDLSRGCTVPDIINTVAITACQAQ